LFAETTRRFALFTTATRAFPRGKISGISENSLQDLDVYLFVRNQSKINFPHNSWMTSPRRIDVFDFDACVLEKFLFG
jgi:hypothetical protein